MNFTNEQQRVIDERGKNILVSASAGSGKTAVLVARIMKKVCEENVDIDRLLIVTFTNAAAAEMRERIHNALMERIEEEPENEHLQKQLVLLMNAQITTIHSFCLYLLKNHFERVDMDPSFRMGDEGEMKLMKNDVLDELLEEYYAKGDSDFLEMMEAMTSKKRDDGIKEQILSIYEFAMSYPWPKEWLSESAAMYECEDINQAPWMELLLADIRLTIKDLKEQTRLAIKITELSDGPYMYGEALEADLKLLETIAQAETYEEMAQVIGNISYKALGRKKDDSVSECRKEQVKGMREQVKKALKEIKEQYFFADSNILTEQMQKAGNLVCTLTKFTKDFIDAFSKAKREKAMVDFNDLEHFAIEILMDGEKKYTEVALELQEHFDEIMTDEYQDSNMVQEIILTAVSKIPLGGSNMFMVGDVKQGIYRFRLARPELFMEKHDLYIKEEVADSERIDLHKNFRSRGNVIKTVNFMFSQLMRKEFGNIEYDETEALFLGADYENKEGMDYSTELLLVETMGEDDTPLAENEEFTKIELEARMIAERIKKAVAEEFVYDKKQKTFRKAEYGDVVILLRTMRGYAETIGEVLKEYDIPVLITSRTGYFAALEVQTVLNMLSVIDNPKQDIPLAAVLSSPIGNLSSLELATIKSGQREVSFVQAVENYKVSGSEDKIRNKLVSFYAIIEEIRKMVPYTPIHSLIEVVLKKTGYLHYVAAMPGGKQRRANLEMLVEKAVAYENSSYCGLFNFLRYIEQLKKYEVDFGEASSKENADNSVKIMSIHKSKGLEFPICFLAATYKNFNLQDTRGKLCLDLDFGIGVDYYDLEYRAKMPTLFKKVLARKQRQETVAEELRVLYVALTRAEEKLILTGVVEDFGEMLKEYESLSEYRENSLSFHMLSKSMSYLQWILQSLYRHSSFDEIKEEMGMQIGNKSELYDSDMACTVKVYDYTEMIEQLSVRKLQNISESKEFSLKIRNQELYEELRTRIQNKFSRRYQHEVHENIRSKVSVSELKQKKLEERDDIFVEEIFETHKKEPYIPEFIREKEEISGGTLRGNAYHKFMELTAACEGEGEEFVKGLMEELLSENMMDKEQLCLLSAKKLNTFFTSNLAKRMQKAQKEGKLFREQPFLMERDVSEIYPEKGYEEKESILVQGIIDAFFEEEDGLVLVDYKTDRIKNPEELAQRYQEQIVQYAHALKSLKQKEVKEMILFSFHLGREVKVEWKENQ